MAFSVGGNALVLDDRQGFELVLAVPAFETGAAAWQELFEGARTRAERALARPVTHAVLVLAETPDVNTATLLRRAAEGAGLEVLGLAGRAELPADQTPALAAAVLAEDLAPRLELAVAPDPG